MPVDPFPPEGEPRSLLETDVKEALISYYVDVLADTAHKLHIPEDAYGYSESELAAALYEANLDIHAIWLRRLAWKKGVSLGKLQASSPIV